MGATDPYEPAAEPPAQTETSVIRAHNLTKRFGSFYAVKNVSFDIAEGRIVGLIGANGAGKSTLLNAVLGLTDYEGELRVNGFDPCTQRPQMMHDICFIADVATLPKWMTAKDLFDYVEGVHPRFDRAVAMDYLSRTKVPLTKRVKKLSKGMTTQLHLAVVMAIDARLLVLDEPTLGLDILFRKQFYQSLLEEYFDAKRTIIVTTHQVEEVEHILTDVIFIKDGEIVLEAPTEALATRFAEITVDAQTAELLRPLGPIHERKSFGKVSLVFENPDHDRLKTHGPVRGLGLADIFVAKVGEAA